MAASEAWQANGSRTHKIDISVCSCALRALTRRVLVLNFEALRIVAARTLSTADTYLSYYTHNDIAECIIHRIMHKQHVLYVSHSSTFDYLKRITNPIEKFILFSLSLCMP